MVFIIDAGNTTIKLAVFKGPHQVFNAGITTDKRKTQYQYASEFHNIFLLFQMKPEEVRSCIISSVVPEITNSLKEAVKICTGAEAYILSMKLKTGLWVKIDDAHQLGADLIAAAVAAKHKYPLPCAVYDMGTATTISVIDEDGAFIGGAIYPGVKTGLNALTENASQLPHISLEIPESVIGTKTVECMQSGVVYGTASLIDGFAQRIEMQFGKEITHVATGGYAKDIVKYCLKDIQSDDNLLLEGLKMIHDMNVQSPAIS